MKRLYFDLETTGSNTEKDRIVQLGIIVTNEDGEIEISKQRLFNPEMPISPEATAVHGITNADVEDQPKFHQLARALKEIFENKIIIGYNSMAFDIPILISEFDRAKVDINLSGKFLDVFKIEKVLAPRTLSSTYKKYTGKDLEGAHDAMVDIIATKEILDAQMDMVALKLEEADCLGVPDEEIPKLEDYMYELSGTNNLVDFYGKFYRDEEGWLRLKFGKHKDKRIVDEVQYADWMLAESFPSQIKKLIREDRAKFLKQNFKK